MRNFLFMIIMGLALPLSSAVRTTVNDGDFMDPLTWDCGCFPVTTDDAVVYHDVTQNAYIQLRHLTVKSSGSYSANNYTRITGDVDVELSATLNTPYYIFIFGNYNVDGTHNANDYILIEGANAELSGTGSVNVDSWLTLRNGAKTIKAGTDLTFPSGAGMYMWTGTTTVTNNGKITLNFLGGINSSLWINDQNSTLDFKRGVLGNYNINASAINNEVVYSGNNQTIHNTVNGTYYDLSLTASNLSFSKFLSSDIKILNDLYIETTEFDANDFDTEIYGDWTDIDGRFDPTSSRVSFEGIDQEITATSGEEEFDDLDLKSSNSLILNTALKLSGTISSTTNFSAQGYRIDVEGDWVNNGVFNHGNNMVRMIGSGSSSINGDTEFYVLRIRKGGACNNKANVSIRSSLRLKEGNFITKGKVTFLSDVNGTARLDKVSDGNMIGDVIVQRYFPTTTNDWHLLGSPVQGTSLEDWNDDLLTTGFAGSDYPSFYFNNATYYDETYIGHKDEGLLNAGNITDNVNVGQGWRLYLPAETSSIDVKGPANIGTVNIPLTYTNTGFPLDDGWNLIANPYISTIDWSLGTGWIKSGLNNAVYVWNPLISQYTTFVGGIGTNGGSKFIPSTQSFWVQTNSVSPSLQILEDAKVSNDVAIKNNVGKNDYFKMIIKSQNGYSDEIAIRTNVDALDLFDPLLDALELGSITEGVPGICIKGLDEKDYSVFSYSHGLEEKWLPVGITVSEPGVHKISFENLDRFKDYSCLVLYDNVTEETHLIEENLVLSIHFDLMENENRFTLKVCPPLGQYTESLVKNISEQITTSVVSVNKSDINIVFNNPINGDVHISINDVQGKLLFQNVFNLNDDHRINVKNSGFAGPLFIVIRNLVNNTIETKKVMLR